MSSCARCETSSVFTATVFPGGSKHRCGSCGAQWLALDDAGAGWEAFCRPTGVLEDVPTLGKPPKPTASKASVPWLDSWRW